MTKFEGEKLVRAVNPRHYIIRTSWLFGRNVSLKGHDFPRLMLKLASEQKEVRVVNDQTGSPTYALDLGLKMKELFEADAPFGIYHITNAGESTWYSFAEKVFEIAGLHATLLPISTTESGSKAPRPRNSVLRDTKLASLNLAPMRPWQEALQDYFNELRAL